MNTLGALRDPLKIKHLTFQILDWAATVDRVIFNILDGDTKT